MKPKKTILLDTPVSRKTLEWKLYSEVSGLEDKLYFEKHRESRDESILLLKQGKINKLFQLVAWDKTFLFHPEIIPFIRDAQISRDDNFFKDLSRSVAKNSNKPFRKYEELAEWLELAVQSGIKTESQLLKFCKTFSKYLATLPNDHPFSTLLDDPEELRKFIKRNKTRIFHSLSRG